MNGAAFYVRLEQERGLLPLALLMGHLTQPHRTQARLIAAGPTHQVQAIIHHLELLKAHLLSQDQVIMVVMRVREDLTVLTIIPERTITIKQSANVDGGSRE